MCFEGGWIIKVFSFCFNSGLRSTSTVEGGREGGVRRIGRFLHVISFSLLERRYLGCGGTW